MHTSELRRSFSFYSEVPYLLTARECHLPVEQNRLNNLLRLPPGLAMSESLLMGDYPAANKMKYLEYTNQKEIRRNERLQAFP